MSESRVGRVAAALAATVWVAWASPAQAQPNTGRVSFTTGVEFSDAGPVQLVNASTGAEAVRVHLRGFLTPSLTGTPPPGSAPAGTTPSG